MLQYCIKTKLKTFQIMPNTKNIEVTVLNQISHVIVHQKNISLLLQEVLDILHNELGVKRGSLTLRRENNLIIEASHGLLKSEKKRGKYRIGEGITGKVALNKKSIIIKDISKENNFLDRTKARALVKNIAFICVPIFDTKELLGTLSIDRASEGERSLEADKLLLETIANILADAVATIREEVENRDKLVSENMELRSQLDQRHKPENIVGNCSAMRSIYTMIYQVSASPATVLVRGESGTGKELVARAIHYSSNRKNQAFIAINCAALPENLVESELFGHEKGSFTGAIAQKKGRCELAEGGTLFLDEIGDISLPVQIKLLRFLQEKSFERVGGVKTLKANVRVITATSVNLEKKIQKNDFREDLFYRLNIFPIHIPALRERKSDITLLADTFLSKYNKQYEKHINRISTPAINMMMSYHWPGNVRELENTIERAVLTTTDNVIHGYNLPPSLQAKNSEINLDFDFDNNERGSFAMLVENYERELIVDALKQTTGNISKAGKILKLTQRILNYKIKNMNINYKDYR